MIESKQLYVLGVSYRIVPVSVREGLHFEPDEIEELIESTNRTIPDIEAVVLSTCNRTEFYLVAPADIDAPQQWLAALRQFRSEASILRDECHTYHHMGYVAFGTSVLSPVAWTRRFWETVRSLAS